MVSELVVEVEMGLGKFFTERRRIVELADWDKQVICDLLGQLGNRVYQRSRMAAMIRLARAS